jgi:hypothetical protein
MTTRPVYVHSAARDFAETQRMPEAAYLGRLPDGAKLALFGCGCGKARLTRISRTPWMRVLPLFRLYRCLDCGAKVFRVRVRQRIVYGAVYLPPPPIRPARANQHWRERVGSSMRAPSPRT